MGTDAHRSAHGHTLHDGQRHHPGRRRSPHPLLARHPAAASSRVHHHPSRASLDEEEHLHGPFSPEANADLEGIDGMLARLSAQELRNYPNAVVVIVSDHGFAKVGPRHQPLHPLYPGGPHSDRPIPQWRSCRQIVEGAAVDRRMHGSHRPHDPADTATRDAARALLDKLAADPANGIEAISTMLPSRLSAAFPTHPSSSPSGSATATAAQSPALLSPTHRRRAHTATTRLPRPRCAHRLLSQAKVSHRAEILA